MTRILVHAGFHKTGTTSLQDFLSQNSAALTPYFRFYGKADFLQAGANARIYGQRPFIWRKLRFRRSFRRFLASVPDAPAIVLSRETFSGVMPGHRDIAGRAITDATPVAVTLAQEIISALRGRFGPDAQIEFVYTTRERDSWLDSVHGHLLRSINLTMDQQAFRTAMADVQGPQAQAQAIAKQIAPIGVHTAPLETYRDHVEGPAAAVLDILDVPDTVRATLKPAVIKNTGDHPDQRAAFLALNQGKGSKEQLKSLKEDMRRTSGGGANT